AAQALVTILCEGGVEAELYGDVTPDAHPDWVAGRMHAAPIQIIVPVEQVEAARQVIKDLNAPPEEGWEKDAEGAIEGWLCTHCDTEVAKDEAVCPMCGALREESPPAD